MSFSRVVDLESNTSLISIVWVCVLSLHTKSGSFQCVTPAGESHTCITLSCVSNWSGFVWLIPHQEKSQCCSGSRREIHLCCSSGGCIDVSDGAAEQKWPSFVSVADLMAAHVHWWANAVQTCTSTTWMCLWDSECIYYVPGWWMSFRTHFWTDAGWKENIFILSFYKWLINFNYIRTILEWLVLFIYICI